MTTEPVRPEITVDLNARREDGRIRLTTPETKADVLCLGVVVGDPIWLVDEDVRVSAILEEAEEGLVARVLDAAWPRPTTQAIRARWEKAGVTGDAEVDHEMFGYGLRWEGPGYQARIPPGYGKFVAPLAHAFTDVAHLLAENAELRRTIEEGRFTLSETDRKTFFDALMNPPEPSEKLRETIRAGRALIREPNPWRGLVEEVVHELRNALLPGTVGEGEKRAERAQAGIERGLALSTRLAEILRANEPPPDPRKTEIDTARGLLTEAGILPPEDTQDSESLVDLVRGAIQSLHREIDDNTKAQWELGAVDAAKAELRRALEITAKPWSERRAGDVRVQTALLLLEGSLHIREHEELLSLGLDYVTNLSPKERQVELEKARAAFALKYPDGVKSGHERDEEPEV